MLPAFLATILFSLSVVFAGRTTRVLGGAVANLYRLCVATVLLALWAHTLGQGLGGGGFAWFFLSGLVGFGLGDLALYQALPRIGPRLSILLVQCLAAPMAAVTEWLWMGTVLTGPQIVFGLLILAGVGIAITPKEHLHIPRRVLVWGVVFGIIAAVGQALGAVFSRRAYEGVALQGENVDGLTATYQRILGGLLLGLVPWLWLGLRQRLLWSDRNVPSPLPPDQRTRTGRRRIWIWVLLNGLCGPALGVACYQWALATTPSGIVLPIVAMTPLVVMPLSFLLEGDRPSLRSVVGGIIAALGVAGLTRVS